MGEKLLEELKHGWSFFGKRKFHYFDNTGVTLCEKYKFEDIPVLINGVWPEDCCKVCLNKYKMSFIKKKNRGK